MRSATLVPLEVVPSRCGRRTWLRFRCRICDRRGVRAPHVIVEATDAIGGYRYAVRRNCGHVPDEEATQEARGMMPGTSARDDDD